MQGLSCLPCHRFPTCFPYMPQTCRGKTLHFLVFLAFFLGAALPAPGSTLESAPGGWLRLLPEALALALGAWDRPGGPSPAASFFSYFLAFLGRRVLPSKNNIRWTKSFGDVETAGKLRPGPNLVFSRNCSTTPGQGLYKSKKLCCNQHCRDVHPYIHIYIYTLYIYTYGASSSRNRWINSIYVYGQSSTHPC